MASTEATLNKLVDRLEHLCERLENVGPAAAKSAKSAAAHQNSISQNINHTHNGDEDSYTVKLYDEMVNEPLQKYAALSKQQDALIQRQSQSVIECFKMLRSIIVQASQPTPQSQGAATPDSLIKNVRQVVEMAESNRASPFFNQLSVIASSIPALGWINVTPTPAPYIKEMIDSGTFYSNKVIMENKGKNPVAVEWAKAWDEILKSLYEYVKKHHTTGLVSKFKGKDTGPSGNADATQSKLNMESPRLQHFHETINAKRSQSLRYSPFSPQIGETPSKATAGPQSLENQIKDKKANTELQGNRWVVEYHLNNPQILVTSEEIKQTVYVYKCIGSTVQVKGKVNSISLDNCKKCALVFDSVISQVEVTNNQSAQVQILQKCPLISLDNCDGAQIYLSKESMDIQVITAKSTQVNLLVPQEEEGDYKEFPTPEQYKTLWVKDHFETTAVEKKG